MQYHRGQHAKWAYDQLIISQSLGWTRLECLRVFRSLIPQCISLVGFIGLYLCTVATSQVAEEAMIGLVHRVVTTWCDDNSQLARRPIQV
jgi:hypothetical protein